VQRADPTQFTFATGVLTMNGVTLKDAIPDLDRWYSVDIRLGDSALAHKRIFGGFTSGSSSDMIMLLQLLFEQMRVVRDGRVITLYSK
jgi:ferric-dicitrate binding protein FerR (iron transport regulator)